MKRWLFLAAVIPPLAFAKDALVEERIEVQEKIGLERAALEALKSQKVSVLQILELVDTVVRGATARAARAQSEAWLLKRRLELFEVRSKAAEQAAATLSAATAPRLRRLYRLQREKRVLTLLTAKDISSFLGRYRRLSQLLADDLELLREAQAARRFQARAARQLARMRGALARRLLAARLEAEEAQRQKEALIDLVSVISAQSIQSGRMLRELERAEVELSSLIDEMEAGLPTSGFGALRGRLPLPTAGRIEVGFGKVVNPKFNTTVQHRGIDLRAAWGAPVQAVADGTVVHAGWFRGYGNLVVLDHGEGFHTLVAHLSEVSRRPGEPVRAGDFLGRVGDTASFKGAYLYFELRHRGLPVDPSVWLAAPVGER